MNLRNTLLVAVLCVGACADDPLGTVDVALSGHASSGEVYRLRDAVLTVAPTGQVFHTEDDPDRTVISVRLDAGLHTLQLADGWRLERVRNGVAEPVFAILTSPNPLPFHVLPGVRTPVRLTFRADGSDVTMEPGDVDIGIDVDDLPPSGPDGGVPDGSVPDGGGIVQHAQYIVDRYEVPLHEDSPIRLDIDGDGWPENKLARILGVLGTQLGDVDLQSIVDTGVARGDVLQLLQIDATGPGSDAVQAELRAYDGADAIPAPCDSAGCGRHLQGDGFFRISPSSPLDSVVAGTMWSGRLVASGTLSIRVPFGGPPLPLRLTAARVDLTQIAPGGIGAGLIGGGVSVVDVMNDVIPWLADVLAGLVERDCPDAVPPVCQCVDGSPMRTILALFDRNQVDCAISVDEVAGNPFVETLLAPDLDLDPSIPDYDAVSVVFGVTAVPASWAE